MVHSTAWRIQKISKDGYSKILKISDIFSKKNTWFFTNLEARKTNFFLKIMGNFQNFQISIFTYFLYSQCSAVYQFLGPNSKNEYLKIAMNFSNFHIGKSCKVKFPKFTQLPMHLPAPWWEIGYKTPRKSSYLDQ